ncbi:cell division control protein 2 homolog 3 [Selaginella moellendorffii]|nr:cell division control protein 2 homolog 3 [Selaginella moellendorffii]|eukprot:XP_002962404.2 cell division control protein 2 homolog 3 [Selaginella moellendorffii]
MADYVWASGARLLGAGPDGEVRVGFHRKTGDKVAMKKIYEHECLYDAIINESEILEEVAHDNVVNFLGLTCNNQGTFMVMELMDGSLSDVISSRKLGEHDIRAVMRQILEGLAWIHAHGIVHQDVKTSNVLVKRDGEKNKFVVKLADFATARRLRTRPWSNKVGTLTFNAPELLKGATSFGTAIDVWGAGCIFAEMLLGSDPFDVPDDGDSLNYFVADFAKKLDIDGCGMGYQDRRRERARERILEKMVWWKAEDVRSGMKDPDAVELLKRMLAIDPARRISVQNALKMPYFQEKADDTATPVLLKMTTAKAAARFFERFPKKNVVSYNTMIAGNAQAGELSSCFDLVAKMAIEGLTPDEQAFSVLAASSHGGKLEQGLHHFVLMSGDFEITALREHYDSVTDILGRAGNLELARSVVQAMPFLPAWGSLLGGYQMQSGQGFTQRAARSVSELGLGRANSHTKWYTNSRYIIDFKI